MDGQIHKHTNLHRTFPVGAAKRVEIAHVASTLLLKKSKSKIGF